MVGVKKYQTCTLLSFFSGMYTYKEVSLYHEKKKQTQAEMTELDANKTILCNFKVSMEQFACLLTSDYITPLSFIYIDVHGSSGSVRICDLNRNIINRGDKYISDIIGFQHNLGFLPHILILNPSQILSYFYMIYILMSSLFDVSHITVFLL